MFRKPYFFLVLKKIPSRKTSMYGVMVIMASDVAQNNCFEQS